MYYKGLATIAILLFLPSALLGEDIRFAEHPSVLVNASELADLRKQIDAGGWKSKVYNGQRTTATMHTARGIRTNAQMWLGRSIEIPGRGGHYHHFFCDDGDRLEYPTDQRFAPGPYRCPVCNREYSGKKYEAAVRRLIHFHLAQAALDLGLVAALEERDECAAQSAEILLSYAEAYPGPHTSSTKGGMIYQSLDESMWIIPLAQAYDLIHPRLRNEQRERIEAFLRIVAGGIQGCGTRGNWGSWHLSAVGVVAFAIQDAEMAGWAIAEFERQIRDELGDDGLWPESVHTYHYFPLRAFLHLAEAARHAGIDLYRRQAKPGKTLLSMFTAPLDYAYPDLRLPAINDGWFDAFVPADLYELAYARAKRPEFAWVIGNGYRRGTPAGTAGEPNANQRIGMHAFLFGQDLPEQVEPPARRSINFPVMGICVLRSAGGAMMTFDYGPFLGHGQFDKMGVTLFANDRLWMADYGTPGYGSPILPWYRSTWSHNTVVVDGKNQARTKENAIQLWLGDAEFEAARSTTTQAYPGVTHTRTVIRTPDYFVVLDDLEAEDKHTYDLRWHGEGDLTIDEPLTIQSGSTGTPAGLPAQITDISIGSPRDKLQGRWQDADAGVAFHVSADALFVPMTAQCPAETGSRRIPLVNSRREGTTASFTTVLMPFRSQAGPLSVQRKGAKLVITTAAFSDRITPPADGQDPAVSRQPAASSESR